jgi:YVTN family beta-propeller protein
MRRSLLAVAVALSLPTVMAAQEHTLIALSHSDFTAYELDLITGEIVDQFTALNQPHEGVVSPDGKTLYAAIPQGPHVVIIDMETWEQTGIIESPYFRRPPIERTGRGGEVTVNTSASPHGIALNRDGTKLYIGVETSDIPGIVVYDVRAGRVMKKIDLLLEGGHFLAIDPRTDKLYYPHRADNRVVVIDTRTDDILKIIPIEGGPVGVDFTAGGEALIHSDYDGSVSVVDMETDEVVARIETGGSGAGRLAVSADGRYAASTRGETQDVVIIDIQSREVVATVLLGRGPGFPLFSPASDKLYVMNSGMGDVVVIDLSTMSEEARYKVGVNPFGGTIRHLGGRN